MSATKILWGPDRRRLRDCARHDVGGDAMGGVELGYQPQLGQPWFELTSGVPVYLPPAFFWWWYAYDAYAPDVFVEGTYITPAKCQYRHCRFG
jgi:type IV secretion system protein VirD4